MSASETDIADSRMPAIAEQKGSRRLDVAATKIAPCASSRAADSRAAEIERLRGAQIHDATDTAFDLLGVGILVDIYAGQELGRHVVEAECAPAIGGEDVAAVDLGADIGQATDRDTRSLDLTKCSGSKPPAMLRKV